MSSRAVTLRSPASASRAALSLLALSLVTGCATHAVSPAAPLQTASGQTAQAQSPSAQTVREATPAASVARSDGFAESLLEVMRQFDPEEAASIGVVAAESSVGDVRPDAEARAEQAYRDLEKRFTRLATDEADVEAKADLAILADACAQRADAHAKGDPSERGDRAYVPVARSIYSSISGLLSEPVTDAHRLAASKRLKAYAGLDGSTPLTEAAEQRLQAWLKSGEGLGPARTRLTRDIADTQTLLQGLAEDSRAAKVPDADAALKALETQLARYSTFLTEKVLPRANPDDRLTPAQYRRVLRERGIDMDPDLLAKVAREAFVETRKEAEPLLQAVAKSLGIPGADFKTVLTTLRKQQVPPAEVLSLYQRRQTEIDGLIRTHHLMTLPELPLTIRVASAAEGAMMAAPHYNMPSLMGNAGGTPGDGGANGGDFVLPAPEASQGPRAMDDFNSPAASWWLTAHEGHPGHALQFAAMMSQPMSLARRYFAFNSANCEGWGLYAEGLIYPHAPPEGQLAILQARLMRQAHAFLDIELNLGRITAADAHKVITDEVGMSEGWADLSIKRYTFMLPGQAPSYFFGARALEQIRNEVQAKLGRDFNLQAFNDFVLAQGLVPPTALRTLAQARWGGGG